MRSLPLLVVAVALAAGCGASGAGIGEPVDRLTAAPSRLAPPSNLPPLDLTAAGNAPCSLMTETIRDEFGLVGRGIEDQNGVTGPDCSFTENPITDPVIVVGINTKSQDLEGLYARRENFTSFEPLTVLGYPALALQQDAGGCGVVVGVAEDELTSVDVRAGSSPSTARSVCDLAISLSSAIIADLG